MQDVAHALPANLLLEQNNSTCKVAFSFLKGEGPRRWLPELKMVGLLCGKALTGLKAETVCAGTLLQAPFVCMAIAPVRYQGMSWDNFCRALSDGPLRRQCRSSPDLGNVTRAKHLAHE